MNSFSIIGAGAWGSALAEHIIRKQKAENDKAGSKLVLWSRKGELPSSLKSSASRIAATSDLSAAASSDVMVIATPAQSLREVLTLLVPHLRAETVLISAAKGIEEGSGLLLSDVAYSVVRNPFLVLSGPSFAEDVAKALPTALTLAGSDQGLAEKIVQLLATPEFRLYRSDDLIGVQLGGAAKNVIAIACGIAMGAGLGENARAALITRGLAEMMRLAQAAGAKKETLTGLSGLGDLALTCASLKSRNFSFGMKIGQGTKPADARNLSTGVVEGVFTAGAILTLAESYGVELPICSAVHAVAQGTASVKEAMQNLLLRPLTTEN